MPIKKLAQSISYKLKKQEELEHESKTERDIKEVRQALEQAGNPKRIKDRITVLENLAMRGNQAALKELSPSGSYSTYSKLLHAWRKGQLVPGRI